MEDQEDNQENITPLDQLQGEIIGLASEIGVNEETNPVGGGFDSIDYGEFYRDELGFLVTRNDYDLITSYVQSNRSVDEYLTAIELADDVAESLLQADGDGLIDSLETILEINESALPRFEEYTPLTSYVLDIPISVLNGLPVLASDLNLLFDSATAYVDQERVEIESYVAGGPYTFITREEYDQVTGGMIPSDDFFGFFDVLAMFNQEEGLGLNPGDFPDPEDFDLQNPGGGVEALPTTEIQEVRSAAIAELRPEDGTGANYFDIAEFSNGFDLARDSFMQIEQSSIEGSAQDEIAKSYLELDSQMFASF